MKFENKPSDKFECLFQGFYLLFDPAANADQQDEICKMLLLMLVDPDITKEHAQQASDRAIEAHMNEKKLEATFNG
tara:strand:+ start:822 stop:1049 length:228 start_codon:yes stop_codon:yes gene_type:complete